MVRFIQLLAVLASLSILWLIVVASKQDGIIFFTWAESIKYGDKMGHVALSATLTVLLSIVTGMRSLRIASVPIYWGVALAALLLTAAETTHHFNALRSFELGDLAANLVGVLIGAAVTGLLHPMLKKLVN